MNKTYNFQQGFQVQSRDFLIMIGGYPGYQAVFGNVCWLFPEIRPDIRRNIRYADDILGTGLLIRPKKQIRLHPSKTRRALKLHKNFPESKRSPRPQRRPD